MKGSKRGENSHPYIGGPAERSFGPLSRPRGGIGCFAVDWPCMKTKSFPPLSRMRKSDYHISVRREDERVVSHSRDEVVTDSTDLGRLLRVAQQPSTLHRPFLFCRPGEGEEIVGFCPVFDGSCRPASDPLRRIGGPTGFQGTSRPPHHLTRIPRSQTSTNPHLMHDPHQERVRRGRLSHETLGVGSLAFRDMPLPVEFGGPDKPLVSPPLCCLFTWRIQF